MTKNDIDQGQRTNMSIKMGDIDFTREHYFIP